MKHLLYTDGTYYPKLNTIGIGGHLDNEQCEQVWEFSEKFENPKITNQFKIQGILHGLNKCLSDGLKHVECFTDDQTLVATLNTSNKQKLGNFHGRNPLFKELLHLVKKFDAVDFTYLPKNENRIASSLARELIEDKAKAVNSVKHTPVDKGAFELSNLLTRSKFDDNREFMNLKVDIVKHYVLDLDAKAKTLKIYEIEKYPEIKVVSENTHRLNDKWTGHSIDIINDILSNTSEKEIGFIFNPPTNPVVKILKGLEPISFNTKAPLAKLTEVSSKFDKIVIHDDANMLEAALSPPSSQDNEIEYLQKREIRLVENLKLLSDPDYKLGSNPIAEKFLGLSQKQLEDLVTVQNKYLGEIIRISTRLEKLAPEDNLATSKEKAVNKVEAMKAKLESKGIKFKM
jgi:ribonuclease HI